MVISRKRFFVSAGILLAAVISAAYFTGIISTNSFACEFEDEKFCVFLKKLDSDHMVNISGKYTEDYSGNTITQVNWILNKDSQALKYYQKGKEEMSLLIFNDYIYLKDYTDGRWWQQSKKDAALFSTKLPFEPSVFFANLNTQLKDPENSITFAGQDICLVETCNLYNIKSSDAEKITKLYLSETQGVLKKIEIVEGETVQTITIEKSEQKIERPDKDVKVAKAKDNIFLNNFLERSQMENKKPQYLQEFEKARLQVEESGDLSGAPKYVDPNLTLTPSQTPF